MDSKSSSASSNSTLANHRTDSSDSEPESGFLDSPRKTVRRTTKQNRSSEKLTANGAEGSETTNDELAYVDTLPEEVKLVEVTSNIWGTKFKIHGLAKTVPANLGQVTYKTSLLHLQPRQMTLVITELRDDYPTGPDPTFNPNIFSEDEDDHLALSASSTPIPLHRRSNEGAPPIAPMSPRPSRFTTTSTSSSSSSSSTTSGSTVSRGKNKNEKRNCLGPLAKAESYEDDFPLNGDAFDTSNVPATRPRHIETSRPGPSYTSLVTQYSRSSSNSGGQSRHAISPLCCEGSVPTLQSPKNAVGPSDFIFERPPATQTSLMNFSGGNSDYVSNIVQVKSVMMGEQLKTNAQINPVPTNGDHSSTKMAKEKLNQRKKDIQFIDDETPSTSNASAQMEQPSIHRTPTVVSISPVCATDSMTRSCSVGFLDSVEMVPSDVALSILRKETPHKRLVLVDRKPNKKTRKTSEGTKKMKLVNCGKSKSLDSCDLTQMLLKSVTIEPNNVMPKLCESSENDHSLTAVATNSSSPRKPQQHSYIETSIINTFTTSSSVHKCKSPKKCTMCKHSHESVADAMCINCRDSIQSSTIAEAASKATPSKSRAGSKAQAMFDHIFSEPLRASGSSSNKTNNKLPPGYERKSKSNKKNTEVITSYTDSPLFSRKHRFGGNDSSDNRSSPLLARKFESGFSYIKQLSEARKRRKEENNAQTTNSNADLPDADSEPKASVSLHTQALTTLENIISRLRDLDDGRLTPPSSPKTSRLPHSSPASPAMSKKGKRNQSSSPIRQILNSPLLNRRYRRKQQNESSDDESSSGITGGQHPTDENNGKHNYRDLETFQKAQLRQKVFRFSPSSVRFDGILITI